MNELEALYKQIQPKIYAFFFVKTSSSTVAEDLTHDVFYEACKGIESFQGKSTMNTWLFSIAKNTLRNYYRSKKYQRKLTTMLKDEVNTNRTPEEVIIINEETHNLIRQIQALDDLQKEIVILRIYGELSFREIGELIHKSENYARVTFHRIKLKLQREAEGN